MIIETAFFKLLESLLSHKDQEMIYEEYIKNIFTNCIVLELNARNIQNPLEKIYFEKRYERNVNKRCDIFLDFSEFLDKKSLESYGIKAKSWIEVKYFGGLERNKGSETKSENAGAIIKDIIRLLSVPDSDAKYCLIVFNCNPKNYLAYKYRNREEREWLKKLTEEGINNIKFNINKEPNVIKKQLEGEVERRVNIITRNIIFKPIKENKEYKKNEFYGFLINIVNIIDEKKLGEIY